MQLTAEREPDTPTQEPDEGDKAAEDLDLDLPPNESAPGHHPDPDDEEESP